MSQTPPPPGSGSQWGWDGSEASQGHWPAPPAPPTPPSPQKSPSSANPPHPSGAPQTSSAAHPPGAPHPHPSGGRLPGRGRPGLIALVAVAVLVLGAGLGWGLTTLLSDEDTAVVAVPSEAPSQEPSEAPASAPSDSPDSSAGDPGAAPTADELPDDPTAALEQLAENDEAQVVADLEGMWVPQISSKRTGMEIDGETWTDEDILADHQALRDEHPRVRLLWSGDFGSFEEGDFWITIAGIGYSDHEQALSWCATNGLGPDDCYAKQLNTGGGHDGTTRLQ